MELTDRIIQLEKAHGRLFNQLKSISDDYYSNKEKTSEILTNIFSVIESMNKKLKEIEEKSIQNKSIKFENGQRYRFKIVQIIDVLDIGKFTNGDYSIYELMLNDFQIIFKAYVRKKTIVTEGSYITFNLDIVNKEDKIEYFCRKTKITQ